jgi:hypothetical protein
MKFASPPHVKGYWLIKGKKVIGFHPTVTTIIIDDPIQRMLLRDDIMQP